MRQISKICYLTILLNLMALTGYAAALPPQDATAEEPAATEAKTVVARVNGTPIYEEQIKPQVEKTLAGYRRYGAHNDNPVLLKRTQMKVLSDLIGNMLVRQEAEKREVENMDTLVEERVKALEKKFEMERYLKLRRLTMEELREGLKERVRLDEYLKEHGVLEPEVPEERIREMYEKNPENFPRPASAKVRHLLIKVDADAGDQERKQARQKAERIRKEILKGKDFAETAKEYSDCSSASRGGELEPLKKGYMPAAFDKAAYALEKDAVSEVVETQHGYHVIKLLDKQPAGVVPYEEIRNFLLKYLQEGESKKKLAEHMAELKKKAEIEILLK
jgi:peptidyl-prolyl cis-trans isomerase C